MPLEDDSLKKFWEIEDYNMKPVLSLEEKSVVQHFESLYSRDERGRFIVPLPRKSGVVALGESRTQEDERFVRLERSLRKRERSSNSPRSSLSTSKCSMRSQYQWTIWTGSVPKSITSPCTLSGKRLAPPASFASSLTPPLRPAQARC